MLLYSNLTITQQNKILANFDGGADWTITGFLWYNTKLGLVGFYKLEESSLTH